MTQKSQMNTVNHRSMKDENNICGDFKSQDTLRDRLLGVNK